MQGLLDHAARWHAQTEIVSRSPGGAIVRETYEALRTRPAAIGDALRRYGIGPGDRVASLAMNSADHMALSYGVTGAGAVFHTLNPRLSTDQLSWIARHAGNRILFADEQFLDLAWQVAGQASTIVSLVSLVSLGAAPHSAGGQTLAAFASDGDAAAGRSPIHEEDAAGLCYTSGTTGDPKGVVYSHRSNVLHTLITLQPDVFSLSANDVILPIVPMYHANGWGLTFAATAVGAKLVMPGAAADGASLYALMAEEGVTFAAGVPTVWLGLLEHMAAHDLQLPRLRLAINGGAALSPQLMAMCDRLGVPIRHAWGMTEMSPVGGACAPSQRLDPQTRERLRLKQGRVPYGIDKRIVDEAGAPLPHDGAAIGTLKMRGAGVVRRYYARDEACLDADDFFDTAISRRSTGSASWRSSIGPKTSSSRAASGSAR